MTSGIFNEFMLPWLLLGVLSWPLIPVGMRWKRGEEVAVSMKLWVVVGMIGVSIAAILWLIKYMEYFLY